METYIQIVNEFSKIAHIQSWEEVQILFRRVAFTKPKHWLLPLHTCEAVGGTLEQALPALVAVASSHIGIILVDDMLDADPRGEHLRLGSPLIANMASALQSAALAAINGCNLSADLKLIALESINEMFLSTTLGQYWDIQAALDEEGYLRIVQSKSSPFFGAAFHIGALMGGASPDIAEQIKKVGRLYGEMIQIHDDINDSLATPAGPDWTQRRSPLPILYAQQVEHTDRKRFLELRRETLDEEALNEAQEILIKSGAISYCIDQLIDSYQQAHEVFTHLKLAYPEKLNAILEEVILPVRSLFEGVEQQQSPLFK